MESTEEVEIKAWKLSCKPKLLLKTVYYELKSVASYHREVSHEFLLALTTQ